MTLAPCPPRPQPLPAPRRPGDLTARVRFLTRLLGLAVAGLVVWLVVLGVDLPATGPTRQWQLLWVGFDSMELVALVVTLWATYRSRQLAIPAALVTGTLFACDAWFDVVLSWGTRGWWFSLAAAALVELPLAALLWGSARSMAHAVVASRFPRAVDASGGPHLRRLDLVPSEEPAALGHDLAIGA